MEEANLLASLHVGEAAFKERPVGGRHGPCVGASASLALQPRPVRQLKSFFAASSALQPRFFKEKVAVCANVCYVEYLKVPTY